VAVDSQSNLAPVTYPARRSRGLGGAILITIGGFLLLGEFLPSETFGQYFLLALGAIFLAWGIAAHKPGLLIPGSILTGLGAGVCATVQYHEYLPAPADGGFVFLGLALGFAGITLLSTVFAGRTYWWALIPASILGLIGSAFMAGVETLPVLAALGKAWPAFLIVIGVVLLLRRGEQRAV
jgi:hypothetical protein